jgi:hypothetical protein
VTGVRYSVAVSSGPADRPASVGKPASVGPQAGSRPPDEAARAAVLLFARACSELARVRPVPVFRWAAEGLVVQVPGVGTGLVRPADSASAGPGPELGGRAPQLAAMGASAALVAAALTASTGSAVTTGSRDPLKWICSVGPVLAPPVSPGRAGPEWLGYARAGQGWIGLVLPGPEAQATWQAAVATLGVLSKPPLAAATLIQQLGIAAFPARRPAQTDRPAEPADRAGASARPSPSPVLWPAGDCVVPAVAGRSVVDLGRVVAAPFAADILEGLGADVRRVRPPDPARVQAPGEEFIDLSDPAGADEIAGIVEHADLVVENFRPRGWAAVQAVIAREPRRRIAIRGFAAGSPLKNWKMYGFLVEGFFGIGARPCGPGGRAHGGAVWDRLCGVVAAAAAIRQLAADAPAGSAGEISQVGLARMWVAVSREAGMSDRVEGRLGS